MILKKNKKLTLGSIFSLNIASINHLDLLKEHGINTDGVEISQGKTFHWTGEYSGNLNEAKTISTDLNVFETFIETTSADGGLELVALLP